VSITFRDKLILVAAPALVALAAVVAVSRVIAVQQAADLTDVEERLVPRLELGPKLESEFQRLRRSVEDAVAAEDKVGLEATRALEGELLALVESSKGALDPGDAASLRRAIDAYYAAAFDISRRLIAGETGEALVSDMAKMQALDAEVAKVVQAATSLSRNKLAAGFSAVREASERASDIRFGLGIGSLVLAIGLALLVSRGVLRSVTRLSGGFSRFGSGDFSSAIPVIGSDELARLAEEANRMAESLRRLAEERDRDDWLKEGQVGLAHELRGELEVRTVAERSLTLLAGRVDACAGALYVCDQAGALRLESQYALSRETVESAPHAFESGESLPGRAMLRDDLLVVNDAPADYFRVRSGLGEAAPRTLVLLPLRQGDQAVGVLELALFTPCTDQLRALLTSIRETLVITLLAAKSRATLRDLLEESQSLAERLAAQEEELRASNQGLESQQDELRRANDELEAQRSVLSEQNAELEFARGGLQEKAEELAKVSTYKSQFLANMSHELRTPLNSMLLLSHLLAENEAGNLSAKQVEQVRTIHGAGKDLLSLINQILDLAKIEAGKQELHVEAAKVSDFVEHARRVFGPLASDKGLDFQLEVAEDVPETITTDRHRLERILSNLLGNAIKFTERGSVKLSIHRPSGAARLQRSDLAPESSVAFSVSDTGIGVAPEAQKRIFAPFEQLEARTDRRYGGTGLGLAIARESARLLGGELGLFSEQGRGSTFTCYLPERLAAPVSEAPDAGAGFEGIRLDVPDDRVSLVPGTASLLVVEDEALMARELVDIIHARGFKVVVTGSGEEALALAREKKPLGIILDVKLPDIDGWTVMERLRQDAATRGIPVHFISALDAPERGLALGAVGYLTKPVTHAELVGVVSVLTGSSEPESTRVLVVEDGDAAGESIMKLLEEEAFDARLVTSAAGALEALSAERFGCMILDLGLPDMDGLALLQTLTGRRDISAPRVVVHTARALTKDETRRLEAYAEAIVLKDGSSAERLLEEMRLFLRHVEERLPPRHRSVPALPASDLSLDGATLLVADDDMRTVYALSGLLRGKGANVLVADTGREALDVLAKNPDVHGVLMDVMMPEMDGYEAMRRLRKDERFSDLPVIALTAKALKGERERCLEAGASDYLTKPVDGELLIQTLKTWFSPGRGNGSRRER
jgi:hypothetical protein